MGAKSPENGHIYSRLAIYILNQKPTTTFVVSPIDVDHRDDVRCWCGDHCSRGMEGGIIGFIPFGSEGWCEYEGKLQACRGEGFGQGC